jgi:hypothetical protein
LLRQNRTCVEYGHKELCRNPALTAKSFSPLSLSLPPRDGMTRRTGRTKRLVNQSATNTFRVPGRPVKNESLTNGSKRNSSKNDGGDYRKKSKKSIVSFVPGRRSKPNGGRAERVARPKNDTIKDARLQLEPQRPSLGPVETPLFYDVYCSRFLRFLAIWHPSSRRLDGWR